MTKERSGSKIGNVVSPEVLKSLGVSPEVLKSLGVREENPVNLNEEKERRHYLFRGNRRKGVWNPKHNTLPKTRIFSKLEKELIMTSKKGNVRLLVFNTMWEWDTVLADMIQHKIQIEKDAPITTNNIKRYFQDRLGLPDVKVNSVGPRITEIFKNLGYTEPVLLTREAKAGRKIPTTYHFTNEGKSLGYKGLFEKVSGKVSRKALAELSPDLSSIKKKAEAKVSKADRVKKLFHGHDSITTMLEGLRKAGVEEVSFKLRA